MAFDPRLIAARIETALLAGPQFRALPSKLGFAIDGGGAMPLRDTDADIRLEPARDPAHVTVGVAGSPQIASVAIEDAADAAVALTQAFLDLRANERRMRALIERIGADAVFAASGLRARDASDRRIYDPRETVERPLGLVHLAGHYALGVAAPFGAWTADQLRTIAAVASLSSHASLRVTPSRVLLIVGLTHAAATLGLEDLAARGLIVGASDPRASIAACVGAPACASASVPTRPLAQDVAALINPAPETILHISGCAKGCAHPHAAPVTLVGREGRYDLVLDGRADGVPSVRGLALDDVAAEVRRRRPI